MNSLMCQVFSANTLIEVQTFAEYLHQKSMSICMTNGCFDMVHYGHLEFLNTCRNYGDLLVVALNTDQSIRDLKGEDRPIMSEEERIKFLQATKRVSAIILFDTEKQLQEIYAVMKPRWVLKDKSYEDRKITGHANIKNNGGRIVFVDRLPISSTDVMGRIKRLVLQEEMV